jgi:hypothetical protein
MAILCFAPLGNPNLLFALFLANRILSGTAEATSGDDPPQIYLPRAKRQLLDRLLEEKIPVAGIARITDLDENLIRAYAARK